MENVIQASEVQTIIADFAKANKIGKAKLTTFVSNVLENLPRKAVPVSTRSTLTKESVKIREHLRTIPKGKTFTSLEVAETLKVHPAMVNNNLRFMAKNEGLFSVAGTQSIPGKRGKPALIWKTQ